MVYYIVGNIDSRVAFFFAFNIFADIRGDQLYARGLTLLHQSDTNPEVRQRIDFCGAITVNNVHHTHQTGKNRRKAPQFCNAKAPRDL